LGCVFYFALAGIAPFSGQTAGEVLQAHLGGNAAPLQSLRPDVPHALVEWIRGLMARNPGDRPVDAVAALAQLESLDGIGHPAVRQASPLADPLPLADGDTGRIDFGFVDAPPVPVPQATVSKKKWPHFALVVCVGLVLSAFATVGMFSFFQKNSRPAFRIHGSNTIGSKLAPALVEGFLAKQGHRDIHTVAAPESVERRIEYIDARTGRSEFVEIHAHGSRTAFSGLRDDLCDLAMSSSRIKESDALALKTAGLGDLRSPGSEVIAALDGLAILVHPSNSVAQLDRTTVAAVFEGKISDWSELGRATSGKIHLHARDANSGTFDFFQSLVLESGNLSTTAARHEDSAELSRSVASDPDAIGFAALPYVLDCKPLAIGDSGAPPQIPSRFTVATEDYALSRRLYFYAPSAKSHPWTRTFLDFVASAAGQEIVSQQGFVKQTPVIQPGLLPANAPDAYKRLLAGAERVGMNARFDGADNTFDSKARLDLGRLVELMSLPENRNRELVLIGFHEDTGQASADLEASRQSAISVGNELEKRGLQARHIEAFGAALPVASSSDAGIRTKNRRVEVWIRKPQTTSFQ